MPRKIKDRLIKINWKKLKGYFIAAGEFILKTILRILILIMRTTLNTYKGIKKFAKSKQKGTWIILLLSILFWIVFLDARVIAQEQQKYQELQFFHQKQIKETDRLFKENLEVKKELEEAKKKLEAKLNKPATVASARIINTKPLSEEIKQIVAKHADAYGVSRKYSECIIALESGGRSEATGDNGKAQGVAQYHLSTYLADAERVGLPVQDDRRNDDRAILAMVGALSRGEDSKWTVSSYCT